MKQKKAEQRKSENEGADQVQRTTSARSKNLKIRGCDPSRPLFLKCGIAR